MAKKTMYVCDRCGDMTDNCCAAYRIEVPIYDGSGENRVYPIDLCGECYKEWQDLIKGYFAEVTYDRKAEKTTVIRKASPYDIIKDNEELQRDIAELEMELERLRDVKNVLYATNFLLTEKLREAGVEVD